MKFPDLLLLHWNSFKMSNHSFILSQLIGLICFRRSGRWLSIPSNNYQAHLQNKKVSMLLHHFIRNSPPLCKLWPMGGAFARFCGWRTDLKRVNAFLMAPFIIENCFPAPYPLESPKLGQNHEREWTSDPISQPPLHPKSFRFSRFLLKNNRTFD